MVVDRDRVLLRCVVSLLLALTGTSMAAMFYLACKTRFNIDLESWTHISGDYVPQHACGSEESIQVQLFSNQLEDNNTY